jgi:hypothetical protein
MQENNNGYDKKQPQTTTTQIVISRNLIKPAESAPTAGGNKKSANTTAMNEVIAT